jgi:hypothetical protein
MTTPPQDQPERLGPYDPTGTTPGMPTESPDEAVHGPPGEPQGDPAED